MTNGHQQKMEQARHGCSTLTTTAGEPPSSAPRRRFRLSWWLFLLPALLVPLGLAWLVATTQGLQTLAAWAGAASGGQLQFVQIDGRLLGPLRIAEVHYRPPGMRISAHQVEIDWQLGALFGKQLDIHTLTMERLEVATTPSTTPAKLPASLQLPLAVNIQRATLGELKLLDILPAGEATHFEMHQLATSASSDGRLHKLGAATMGTFFGTITGDAQLDGQAPFDLQGALKLAWHQNGSDQQSLYADALASGKLSALQLRAQLSGFQATGTAVADLTLFAAMSLARLQADLQGIDPRVFHAGAPQAQVDLQADLQPVNHPGEPMKLAGPVRASNRHSGPIDKEALPIDAAEAQLTWSGNGLQLEQLALTLPGKGRAEGSIQWDKHTWSGQLALRDVNAVEIFSTAKPTRLSGELSTQLSVEQQSLNGQLRDPRFAVRLMAQRQGDTVTLETAHLEAKGSSIDISGQMQLTGSQAFTAKGKLNRFDPSVYVQSPPARINADFNVSGQWQTKPKVAGQFLLRDSQFDGKPLAGQGRLDWQGEQLSQVDIRLDMAGNHLNLSGAYGRPADRLNVNVDAPRLAVLGKDWNGSLQAQAQLAGTLQQPGGQISFNGKQLLVPGQHYVGIASGNGELQAGKDGQLKLQVNATDYRAQGQPQLQQLNFALEGSVSRHHVVASTVLAGGHRLQAKAEGGWQAGSPGKLKTKTASAGSWMGQLTEWQIFGKPPIRSGQMLEPAKLELSAEKIAVGPLQLRSEATVVRMDELLWTPGKLVSRGAISGLPVGLRMDDRQQARITRQGLVFGAEWQIDFGEQANGTARIFRESGDLVLDGDSPVRFGLSQLEARANVLNNRLGWSLEGQGKRLGLLTGAGSAQLQRTAGGGWRLVPEAPLSGSVRIAIPAIDWLGPWLNPDIKLGGSLNAEFSILGTGAKPEGQGAIRGEQLTVSSIEYGSRLIDGDLHIAFDDQQVKLENLSFITTGKIKPREARIDSARLTERPGKVSVTGAMELATGKGHLHVEADRFLVAERPDRWLMLTGSGDVATTGARGSNNGGAANAAGGTADEAVPAVNASAPAGARLNASVAVEAGYWELARTSPPSLGDDVTVKGRETSMPSTSPLALIMDVAVKMGRSFYFQGRGLDSRLTGDLRIQKDGLGPLRAKGSITSRDGTFDAYGRKLTIERGIVNFLGPLDNPGLNVLALRKQLPVEAGVAVTGTVANPQIKLVSEPNVPDSEKLSWIVLGHGPDQGSKGDSALLLAAANSILGGKEGGITQQLAQSLGFDDIGLATGQLSGGPTRMPVHTVAGSPSAIGDANATQQIFTVGKQLSANAQLSFERSLAGAESIVKLTYRLTRRLSLIGRAGADNAIDITYGFSFE